LMQSQIRRLRSVRLLPWMKGWESLLYPIR